MVLYGLMMPCMFFCGPVYTCIIVMYRHWSSLQSCMVLYWLVRSSMVMHGQIWSCVVFYCPLRSCLLWYVYIIFVWSFIVQCGYVCVLFVSNKMKGHKLQEKNVKTNFSHFPLSHVHRFICMEAMWVHVPSLFRRFGDIVGVSLHIVCKLVWW